MEQESTISSFKFKQKKKEKRKTQGEGLAYEVRKKPNSLPK